MGKINLNKEKELADNLKLDYDTFDTQTLNFAQQVIEEELYNYGLLMTPTVKALKQLRLAIIRETLARRDYGE